MIMDNSRNPISASVPRVAFGILLALLSLSTLGLAASPLVPGRIVRLDPVEGGLFRLSWQSVPGRAYDIESAVTLLGDWQRLNSEPIIANSVVGTWEHGSEEESRYYRIRERDESPPEIELLTPLPDSFAVAREMVIVLAVVDDSPVDSSSIRFALGEAEPLGVDDLRLTFTDNLLRYEPDAPLGGFGDTVHLSVSAADMLGNQSETHHFEFELELELILAGRIVNLGLNPDGSLNDEILKWDEDSLLVAPSVAEKGLEVGDVVVGVFGDRSFVHSVEGIQVNPFGTRRLLTAEASLSDVILQGSLRMDGSVADLGASASGLRRHRAFEGGESIKFGESFNGLKLVDRDGLLVEIGQGVVSVEGRVYVALELGLGKPARFAADLNGLLSGRLGLVVRASKQMELPLEVDLMEPIKGKIPLILPLPPPVFRLVIPVDVEFSVKAEGKLTLDVEGEFTAGVKVQHDFEARTWYDGPPWQYRFSGGRPDIEGLGPDWDLEGTVNARVGLVPTLSFSIFNSVSLTTSIVPYLSATAELHQSLQTTDVCWRLEAGLDGRVNAAILGHPLQEEPWVPLKLGPYHLSSGRAGSDSPIEFRSQPQDQVLEIGDDLLIEADASACPEPSYSWFYGEEPIPGQVGPSMLIPSVNPGHSGFYHVLVKNAVDEVRSRQVRIEIQGSGPQLIVTPSPLVFTSEEPGVVKELRLENRGDEEALVFGGFIEGPGFSLVDSFSNLSIAPGEALALRVRRTNAGPGIRAELHLDTNQKDVPVVRVSLEVMHIEPSLMTLDEQWLMGIVAIGETERRSFGVQNTGKVPIALEPLELDPTSPFTIVSPKRRLALEPGEELPVIVAFSPGETDLYYETVQFYIEGRDDILASVEVSGAGGLTKPLSIHFAGESQTVKRRTAQNGDWQEVTMNVDLDFQIRPAAPRHEDGFLLSDSYHLTGRSRVWGTAFDSLRNLTINVDKEIEHFIEGFDGLVALIPNDASDAFLSFRFPIINDPRFDDGTGWLYYLEKLEGDPLASVSLPPPFRGDIEFEEYPLPNFVLDVQGGADMPGVLFGTLLHGETDEPLGGVSVSLGNVKTNTDAQGDFEFGEIPTNLYELVVEEEGFERYSRVFTVSPFSGQGWNIWLTPSR